MRTKTFTTGEAAAACDVSPRTVAKWIDRGLLPGYRLGGRSDRRVSREALVSFLREHGMAVPLLLQAERPRLAVFSVRPEVAPLLRGLLPGWDVLEAADPFTLGVKLCESRDALAACVLDLACGSAHCLAALRFLAAAKVAAYALAAEDGAAAELRRLGYDRAWAYPCDLGGVAAALGGLLEEDP